ncbi:hypothetical protein Micbo1qcDRAFT_207793 [Microdochium bolleyi]|uniref:Uncharacterized protein n=1 Tax=Microdochium bolleyi TaxID=196109 RepID=A0A136IT47_9PEZI|nr:hypothetical protein Micbo1qcDRAFT_207793 [Microdochium bolleyi]
MALARSKMVSRATQVGGVGQAAQTDVPCPRCFHGTATTLSSPLLHRLLSTIPSTTPQPQAPPPSPSQQQQNLPDAENDIKNLAEFLGFALGDRKRKRESVSNIAKRQDACPWQIWLKWNRRHGTQPHLYQQWHLIWTGGDDWWSREHNHDMDPDPANISANRRQYITQDIKDKITSLLTQGGRSSSQIREVMKKRHPRIALTKSEVDNMRRFLFTMDKEPATGVGEDEDEDMDESIADSTVASVTAE